MPRTFLDWSRPALPAAAEVLVAAHLGGPAQATTADLSDAIVALPGGRAGRRLMELLLAEAEVRDAIFLPPRIVTVGLLPELLHTRRKPVAPPVVRRLVWARALQEGDREALSRLFTRLPEPDAPLPAWRGLARELAAMARQVAAGALTFADVSRHSGASGSAFDDSQRWATLARVQDDVRRRLDALDLCDPDLERMVALAEGRVHLPGTVWLVGVAELPEVVASMLRAAAEPAGNGPDFGGGAARGAQIHALVHAPADRHEAFDELGLLRPDHWLASHPRLDDGQISVVAGPGEQADAAVRVVAESGGRRTDEVIIGAPQGEVLPALAQRLGRHGIRVRDAAGTPMRRSGPWRLLEALAAVLRDRSYAAVAGLVRHPDLVPWMRARLETHPDMCLAALDRWSARHLPARMVAPYPGVERGGADGADARTVEALMVALDTELLQGLGGLGPLASHMAPVRDALDRVYGAHGPDGGTMTGDRTRQALRVLADVTETLESLPDDLAVRCEGAGALALILDETATTQLPAPPDAGAVELLGWLELHLDDAPVTVVTGVNEGSLPETVRGDPFLPDGLRRELGLEDNQRRLARDLYRLNAMVHSRDVLHLVAARRTAEGDPLRPSRLLFAAADDVVARRVRHFYQVESPAPGHEPPVPGGLSASAATSDFILPPESALALEPFPATLSPTDFRGILADPYRWALARLRGPNGASWPPLAPVDDHAMELDGGAFGDLAHVVLERFGQGELKSHGRGHFTTDPKTISETLDTLLDSVAHARFGRAPRVAVRLQVEQLRVRLRAFARWHAAWVEQGWRMQAAEVTTPATGIPLESEPPVGIRGKIDRIDHHPEHGWAILDYKTADRGEDPTSTHVVRGARGVAGTDTEWRDLQLPLYHWLAPRLQGLAVSGAAPDQVSVGYVLLPRDAEATGEALADWDAATLASGVATARRLVAELGSGPVRYDEAVRPRYDDDPRLAALLGRSILGGDADDDDDGDEA